MNRSLLCAWTVSVVVGTAVGLVGCQPKPKPAPPPPPPPPPPMTVPQQRAADAGQFHAALARYDAHLAGLPGHTRADHRAAAAATLADLTDALRLAYGVNPPPGFDNDVAIVAAAARAVAAPDVPRGRMEGAENQALPAATAALTAVANRVLYDDPGLPPLLDAAAAKAVVARASQGPLHDGDASDALVALDGALHRVDADLQERFAHPMTAADPTPPTPTTMPTSMPTTAPTTMP